MTSSARNEVRNEEISSIFLSKILNKCAVRKMYNLVQFIQQRRDILFDRDIVWRQRRIWKNEEFLAIKMMIF
jgi:hypothetical protein